jgi:TolA-binding protein
MIAMDVCTPTRNRIARPFPCLILSLGLAVFAGRIWAQEDGAEAASQSSAAALTVYSDAANYQNNSAFDLAVDEWSKFLERFPDDPLAAKALHYRGVCQLQLKRYAAAADSFQAVVTKYPDFELRPEAYLHLGWCQYSLARAGNDAELYKQAAESFGRLIRSSPEDQNVDQAIYFYAETLYALGKKPEAAVAYRKLIEDHPKSKLRNDGLYALGVTLEETGKYVAAGKIYDQYLQEFPSSELATEIQMRKAETLLHSDELAAAEQLFAQVAQTPNFAAADHALLRQAYCVARQNRDAEAAAIYAALPERFADSKYAADARLSAGRCFYRAGQLESATGWFQQALTSRDPQTPEAAHWLCRIYLQQGQPAKAVELISLVLPQAEGHPFAANLMLDRADALYAMDGRRSDALAAYLAAYQAHPDHSVAADALYAAAFAALELQQFDQATDLADQFVKTFPQHRLLPDTTSILAECRLQKKQFAEAEQTYRALLEKYPQHTELSTWRNRLGLVQHLLGQHQATIDLLHPLLPNLAPPPIKAEAAYLVGVSQFQLQQYQAASESLRTSILADPKWRDADATLLYLARAQYKLQQWDQALATLASLRTSFPQSSQLDQAAYREGECLYAAGKYAEAAAAYDRLIQSFPESSYVDYAWYGKGWAELKAQQYAPAAASFTALLNKQPEGQLLADALLARGMCQRQLGDHTAAITDINKYLEVNSNAEQRADALYERGLAEAGAGQHEQAAQSFQTLLKESPSYAHADKVLYELAWAQKSLSNPAEAAKTFASLAEKHPDSALAAEAHFHMAEALYEQKNFAQAADLYQKTLVKSTDAELREKALYKLGWSEYQQEALQPALDSFSRQIAEFPSGPLLADARFMKAECLFKLKDFQAAYAAYQDARQDKSTAAEVETLKLLHSSQVAAQLSKWDEGLQALNQLIENYPQSTYLAEAYFERGQAHRKLEQADAAVADFRQAAERSRGVVGARALFMVGELEFQAKQYDEAIKDYQRTMFRFVPSDTDPDVARWQARAAYEAGRCAEVQIEAAGTKPTLQKRLAEARRFYRYVVEKHPQSELAPEAQKRLDTLSKM